MLDNVVINCFRYLGINNPQTIWNMTITEYELLMEAAMYKWVDNDYRAHQQAFLNFAASAKKKKGKNKEVPVYNRFIKFYDYEEQQNKVKNRKTTSERFSAVKNFLRQKGGTNG